MELLTVVIRMYITHSFENITGLLAGYFETSFTAPRPMTTTSVKHSEARIFPAPSVHLLRQRRRACR